MITYRSQSTAPSNPLDAIARHVRGIHQAMYERGKAERIRGEQPAEWLLAELFCPTYLTKRECQAYNNGRYDAEHYHALK